IVIGVPAATEAIEAGDGVTNMLAINGNTAEMVTRGRCFDAVKATVAVVALPITTVSSRDAGVQTTTGGFGGGAAAATPPDAPTRATASATPTVKYGASRDSDGAIQQPLPGRE